MTQTHCIYVSLDTDMKCFKCGETGHLVRSCPEWQGYPGVSEQPGQDAAGSTVVAPPVDACVRLLKAPEWLLHQSACRMIPN